MAGKTPPRSRSNHAEALRDSEALYRSLVDHLPQNIFRKDLKHRLTFANKRYCSMLGQPLESLIGKTDSDLFPPHLARKYIKDDLRVMKTGAILEAEEAHVLPDGKGIHVQVVKTPLYNASGRLIGVQGIFWDVTERHEMQQRLQQMNDELLETSITDALTGAYNRLYLSRELPVVISGFSRAPGILSAVMFDIDDFKKVNDTYGHDAGDQALRCCARSVKGLLRRKSDLLLRLGGDEFVALLYGNEASEKFSLAFARQLLGTVRSADIPAERARGGKIRITLSIGVASLTADDLRDPDCIEDLLKRADRALYVAKERGKNRVVSLGPKTATVPAATPKTRKRA